MSSDLVRELFRNLETTLHDRLRVIEEILRTTKPEADTSLTERLSLLEKHIRSLDEFATAQVRTLAFNHDQLEARVAQVESWIRTTIETLRTVNETVGSLQKRIDDETPVEAAEVQAEIEETQQAALNADADPVKAETKAKAALVKAIQEMEDVEVEEEEEELEEEEEVEEEEVVEEEVEEEEEVVEEVEELELEPFTYRGQTYYRDQNSDVYIVDEDGAVGDVIGRWNPGTKKIERVPAA